MHLVAHKIFKRKGNRQILQGINLEVASGQLTVIVGPRHSGKSQLLKVLAGIDRADLGDIFLQGESLNKVKANERHIGMIFDKPYFFQHLNIYQNLLLVFKKVPGSSLTTEDQIRVRAEELNFAHMLSSMPGELTPMQLFIAQLARALLGNPSLLIIDDPFEQVNGSNYNELRRVLKKLVTRHGLTLLVATRSANQARLLANKLAIIDQGIIRQCDTPAAIYKKPADLHVASTVYTQGLNIISARIVQRFKRFVDCVVCDRMKVRITVQESERIEYDRDAIHICLIATDFSLSQNEAGDLQAIQARLLAVELTETFVYSHWQVDQDTLLEVHTKDVPKASAGHIASIYFDKNDAFIFSDSGVLISSGKRK